MKTINVKCPHCAGEIEIEIEAPRRPAAPPANDLHELRNGFAAFLIIGAVALVAVMVIAGVRLFMAM